jgi:hypothetical protein
VIAVATGRFDEAALAEHTPDALLPDLGDRDLVRSTITEILGLDG